MARLALLGALLVQSLTTVWGKKSPEMPSWEEWHQTLAKGVDGRITIYRGSYWSASKSSSDIPKFQMDVTRDICLSANFTLEDNVMINEPGHCPGGSAPYLAIYPTRNCTGTHSHPPWFDPWQGTPGLSRGLSKAVWKTKEGTPIESHEGEWSMIFRCDTKPEKAGEDVEGSAEMWNISLPERPPPPPPKKEKEWKTASVSDSACFTKDFGIPEFIFQHPKSDICLDIEPKRKLKIYHTVACSGGKMARFAKYSGRGCTGEPKSVEDVTDELKDVDNPWNCITMDDNEWSSYAFICTGDVRVGDVSKGLFPEPDNDETQTRIHYKFGDNTSGRTETESTQSPKEASSILPWVTIWIPLVSRAFNWLMGMFSRD